MVKHELEHIRQGHTIDILVLDVLLIFQWFNPLIWLLKRAVRENHEYLVDRSVLGSGVSPDDYKQLLLSQVAGNQIYAAHHFNYSLLKNRFNMMTKIPSSKIAGIKIISGVLIAFALVVVFACEQKKKVPEKNSPEKTDTLTIGPEAGVFRIAGNSEELKKMNELLLSGKFDITAGNQNGSSYLLLKEKERQADSAVANEILPGEVFTVVEKMPEFPGGNGALMNYIGKLVKYPKEAQDKGIQGKVIIAFVISKDGSVRDAKVIRGVHPVLDIKGCQSHPRCASCSRHGSRQGGKQPSQVDSW